MTDTTDEMVRAGAEAYLKSCPVSRSFELAPKWQRDAALSTSRAIIDAALAHYQDRRTVEIEAVEKYAIRHLAKMEAERDEALAQLAAFDWYSIDTFDLPDHEQVFLWQEGWCLSPIVVGWRVKGQWLCEGFDIDSEGQRPTHWRFIDVPAPGSIPVAKDNAKAQLATLRKALKDAVETAYNESIHGASGGCLDYWVREKENLIADTAQAAKDYEARVRTDALEEAATIIDRHEVGYASVSGGPVLVERYDGSLTGLAYANAIRALKDEQL